MKKKFFLMVIIVLAIIFLILYFVFINNSKDSIKENNQFEETTELEISKIQAYSGIDAVSNTTTFQNPEWNLKINQYTDFAIYLNRLNNISEKNIINSIQITNIVINNLKIGSAKLYYLNPQYFGDINIKDNTELDNIEFDVINDNNLDNYNLNIPIFFEDLSNPITFRYINEGVVDNYIVQGEEKISYDGSLLKNNNIDLNDLKAEISFDILVSFMDGSTNSLKFDYEIPIENDEKNLCEENIFIQDDLVEGTNFFKNDNILVNIHPLNIEKILSDNTSKIVSEEMMLEQIDLEYITEYIDNEELPSGTIWVDTVGQDGKQDVITIKRYENDELVSSKIVASNVNKAAINKVVEIGVGKGKNRFELKPGDVVYSIPEGLPVMDDKSKDSEKILTLERGTPVEILEIYESGWSYIFANSRYGYALSEGFSNINPLNLGNIENMGLEKSKDELLALLSKDMNMGEPSGFSLEQFRDVLRK